MSIKALGAILPITSIAQNEKGHGGYAVYFTRWHVIQIHVRLAIMATPHKVYSINFYRVPIVPYP